MRPLMLKSVKLKQSILADVTHLIELEQTVNHCSLHLLVGALLDQHWIRIRARITHRHNNSHFSATFRAASKSSVRISWASLSIPAFDSCDQHATVCAYSRYLPRGYQKQMKTRGR